jgi:hypothetical protein
MAETLHSKNRTAVRAWLALAALGGVAAALVYRVRRPRRSQPARESHSSEAPAKDVQPENPTTDFEPTDWSLWPVAVIYAGIPALLVIACFVLIAAYPNALPDVDRSLRTAPPGPRLQTDAAGDLQKFRADEERRLNTYYWMDKQKGIVHIPIEQAMKKLVASGAPGFAKGQP